MNDDTLILMALQKWYPDSCPVDKITVYFPEEEYDYVIKLVNTLEEKDLLTHNIIDNTLTLTHKGKREL